MQTNNTIYIIGSGAIGKTLAVFLKHEGKDVVIIRGSIDDQSHRIEKIEVELNDKTFLDAEIDVSTASNYSNLNGLIVFANKSFGNLHLAKTLKTKINNSPIVIMQNGLDVEQPFIANGYSQIYRCILFATSQPLSGNKLKFKPVSVSPIGVIGGNPENLEPIVQQLNNSHFEFRAEQNILPIVWTKAIVNSVFNSVCPLLETDIGIFHRNEAALQIAKRVIAECVVVAESKGIFLDAGKIIDSLLLISKASDGQLISTFQDIRNKRQTEIETLNFSISRIANEFKKEDVVKETRLLGELTKLKAELNQP